MGKGQNWDLNDLQYLHLACELVEFMCHVFTHMPDGVMIGNSEICCCVTCLLNVIDSFCLLILYRRSRHHPGLDYILIFNISCVFDLIFCLLLFDSNFILALHFFFSCCTLELKKVWYIWCFVGSFLLACTYEMANYRCIAGEVVTGNRKAILCTLSTTHYL